MGRQVLSGLVSWPMGNYFFEHYSSMVSRLVRESRNI